jgi:ABC-type Mn2+/Zn2+ transport system permease subunit
VIDVLISPFTNNEFLRLSLAAGIVVSLACSIVGTFVVLRGLAFVGDALAHGVLPGIAGASLLGLPTMVGAAIGTAVMMGGVALVTRRTRLSSDTAVGLLFVAMLALGVVITSRSSSFSGDLTQILFGEVLGVSRSDLMVQVIATVVVGAVAYICRRPFLLLCVDADQADTSGFPSRRYHAIMLTMVAVTIVISFQAVGTLLVFGMLLAPAATGAIITRRIGSMIAVAAVVGSVSTYVGLLASYHADLAAGASIVVTAVAVFFLALISAQVIEGHRNRQVASSHAH